MKKTKLRNLYNQVSHLSQDTKWESDKTQEKQHTQESQEIRPFPAGDPKAVMYIQDSMTQEITKHK